MWVWVRRTPNFWTVVYTILETPVAHECVSNSSSQFPCSHEGAFIFITPGDKWYCEYLFYAQKCGHKSDQSPVCQRDMREATQETYRSKPLFLHEMEIEFRICNTHHPSFHLVESVHCGWIFYFRTLLESNVFDSIEHDEDTGNNLPSIFIEAKGVSDSYWETLASWMQDS